MIHAIMALLHNVLLQDPFLVLRHTVPLPIVMMLLWKPTGYMTGPQAPLCEVLALALGQSSIQMVRPYLIR